MPYQPKHLWRFTNQACKKCSSRTDWSIGKWMMSTSMIRFVWYCQGCGTKTNMYEPNDERIIFTTVWDDAPEASCEVCGRYGAQAHHWAPRHLFDAEADKWPTGFLCQTCHERWHAQVTPNMTDQ